MDAIGCPLEVGGQLSTGERRDSGPGRSWSADTSQPLFTPDQVCIAWPRVSSRFARAVPWNVSQLSETNAVDSHLCDLSDADTPDRWPMAPSGQEQHSSFDLSIPTV